MIGQLQVAPDGNEITAALALIKGLPLEGAVVTGDAAFCQRAICQGVRDRQGDYLFAVKANQPTLMADLAVAFGDPFPPELIKALGTRLPPAHDLVPPPDLIGAQTIDKGHGRIETRTLALSRECVPHLGWPGAAQVCRIERIRTRGGHTSREIAYAITSLPPDRASPADLLALWRDHWLIENRLHRRRDAILHEDQSRIRSGPIPQAMAALRNAVLHLTGKAPGPLAQTRETFAENRTAALTAALEGFLRMALGPIARPSAQ